jgi:hypothetical protein
LPAHSACTTKPLAARSRPKSRFALIIDKPFHNSLATGSALRPGDRREAVRASFWHRLGCALEDPVPQPSPLRPRSIIRSALLDQVDIVLDDQRVALGDQALRTGEQLAVPRSSGP